MFPRLSASPFSLTGDGGRGALGSGSAPPLSARLEDGPRLHDFQLLPGPACRQLAESSRSRLPTRAEGMATRTWFTHTFLLPQVSPPFVGPYVIEKVINPSALRLQLPPSLKVHPVFHVSQVKLVATSALSPPAPTPPPPRVLEGGDLVWGGEPDPGCPPPRTGFQYLVDWVGYGPEDRSWIPRSYLADPSLLEAFYKEHPQAVGQSPGASRREGGTVVNQQAATPTLPNSSTEARADAAPAISTNADQLRAIPTASTKPHRESVLSYC